MVVMSKDGGYVDFAGEKVGASPHNYKLQSQSIERVQGYCFQSIDDDAHNLY